MRRPSPNNFRRGSSASRRNIEIDGDQSTTILQSEQSRRMSEFNNEEQKSDMEALDNENLLVDLYPVFDPKLLIDQYQTIFDLNNTILSLKYSNDDQYVAIGQYDGSLKIFNTQKQQVSYQLRDQQIPSACTAIKWCPDTNELAHQLLAAYADGTVLYWHSTSQRILCRYEEKENPINAIDVSPDGSHFATGGQDGQIRLYNVGKKSLPTILGPSEQAPGHQNRVYGVKFDKNNPNLMISGGWDQMILFWDIRQRQTTGYIYGPKIYSDSFDIQDNLLLTGSWREKNQLEIFDMKMRKKLFNLPWKNYTENEKTPSLVYCCQFAKTSPDTILAGSTGTYEMRLFQRKGSQYECIDIFKNNLQKGVYCLDFCKTKDEAAYGCGDGQFGLLKCSF